jgi:hypothetical protein
MKTASLLLLAALLAPICRADDSLALAGKLLDLTGADAPAVAQHSFDAGLKPAFDRMKAQGMPADLLDILHAEAEKFFTDNFKWEDIKPQLTKFYVDNFTEAELRDLVSRNINFFVLI